ncbi:methyltransferase domain-containing protein [Candidatus Sumerlaeota bacterium]|nr:methyltransferase domain-containing protein [Candidatus Sumerlaeota bacterium]
MKHLSTPSTTQNNNPLGFPDWHSMLVCPRCRSPLGFDEQGGRITGTRMTCSSCNLVFPIKDQIPVMLYSRTDCLSLVDEIVRYHNFYQRILNRRIERDRLAFKNEELQFSLKLLRLTFNSALKHIDFVSSPLLLDVGAAFCETSAHLARRGARVVAIDFSPLDFYNPRFFSLGEETPQDFFDVFASQPEIDPRREGFRQVLCDVHYMPFPDNLFDIVFIRSSLHHCYNPHRAMIEISRVLKPGGKLIIVAEPCRSLLHSQKDYFKKGLDYQEGIREQSFTFSFYPGVIRAAGFESAEFEVFFPSAGEQVMRILNALRLKNPFAWLQGRRLSGKLRPWILLFVESALNIYTAKLYSARRRSAPAEPEEKPYCEEIIQKLNLALANYSPSQKSISELKQLHRRLLAASGKLPYESSFARELPHLSGFGFREPQQIAGRRARFIFRDCSLFIARHPHSTQLNLELFVPADLFTATESSCGVRFFINDVPAEPQSPLTSNWQTVSFSLPPYRRNEQEVIELRIEQDRLIPAVTADKESFGGAEVGIALSQLWQS